MLRMISLTSKERNKLYNTLSDKAKSVLDTYHKETKRSVFFNNVFKKSDGWKVQDIKTNDNYRQEVNENEKLYCDKCGRELKHQYIITSIINTEVYKLGITCLSQQLDVSEKVVKEVYKQKLKIDEWLDDILFNLKLQEVNERIYQSYVDKSNSVLQDIFNKKELQLITDFTEVDLPLPTILQKRLTRYDDEVNRKLKAEKNIDTILQRKKQEHTVNAVKRSNHQMKKSKSIKSIYKDLSDEENKEILMIIASCRMKIWNRLKYKRYENECISLNDTFDNPIKKEKLLSYFTEQEAIQEIIKSVKKYHNLVIEYDGDFIKKATSTEN